VRDDHVLNPLAADEHLRSAKCQLGLDEHADEVRPVLERQGPCELESARIVRPSVDVNNDVPEFNRAPLRAEPARLELGRTTAAVARAPVPG